MSLSRSEGTSECQAVRGHVDRDQFRAERHQVSRLAKRSTSILVVGVEAALIEPVDHTSIGQFSGIGLLNDLCAHLPPAGWILLSQP